MPVFIFITGKEHKGLAKLLFVMCIGDADPKSQQFIRYHGTTEQTLRWTEKLMLCPQNTIS